MKYIQKFPTIFYKFTALLKTKVLKVHQIFQSSVNVNYHTTGNFVKTRRFGVNFKSLSTIPLSLNFNLQTNCNFSTLLLKYFVLQQNLKTTFSTSSVSTLLDNFFFSNRFNFFKKTNLIPIREFNFVLQKKILKIINFDKFRPNVILWYYTTIIRFIEFYSGKKVFFKLNPFIENSLTFSDIARCNL